MVKYGAAIEPLRISYDDVASLLRKRYNGPLQVANEVIDDDRYDMVVCSAAGQPQLDLSASAMTM